MGKNSDCLAVMRRALRCPHGWQRLPGTDSRGHYVLSLPNGRKVSVPSSAGDVNSARNLGTQLAALCGCPNFFGTTGTGKRSRKRVERSGFDPSTAQRLNERFHDQNPEIVDLPDEHARLTAELLEVDPRTDRGHAIALARRIAQLEQQMDRLHIYYTPATSVA